MPRALPLLALMLAAASHGAIDPVLAATPAPAATETRATVEASQPTNVAVTIYRDEDRDGQIDPDWAGGFAMISETRTVTLPPGASRIRFTGVAESMVAVSAIVTGLPGGTIEKNRNADLLSPAALVDGTLGNRVTITRTDPATGKANSETAIVRTRADGGLVLQTREGFEAVRCSGLPERLTFDRVPDGLSPDPVFSIDTHDATGGTYQVTLTYLATGFDWQANYVATFDKASREKDRKLRLMAWLTVANANGQGFAQAALMTVAGKVNVTSDYEDLADPPEARALRLSCYPLGSTAAGMRVPPPAPPAPPPPPAPAMHDDGAEIMVTASRMMSPAVAKAELGIEASEETLGDLRLYRVPVSVDVSANSQKQVRFLDLGAVDGSVVHKAACQMRGGEQMAAMELRSMNRESAGLGRSLPEGNVALFEPSSFGPLLVSEDSMRDFKTGDEVQIAISGSSEVNVTCSPRGGFSEKAMTAFDKSIADGKWAGAEATVTNPGSAPIRFELTLPPASRFTLRRASTAVESYRGNQVLRIDVPAFASRTIRWQMRNPNRTEE